MTVFLNTENFSHEENSEIGVLLVNLGTPEAPTASALRCYLAEFLWDPRVVEFPRLLWWLVLHGLILRIRPARSAKSYQKVWTKEGSPLLVHAKRQEAKLSERLSPIKVALAMRYGKPSISKGLESLRQQKIRRLLVVPLYPQYSATTTASVFDAVSDVLRRWRWLPEIRFISHYHDFPPYIQALATSVNAHWAEHGRADKLLISFHGVPKRYLLKGDPYYCECHKTARLLAENLQLEEKDWQLVFQSRFGREEWLKPYLDETLKALPQQGVRCVDVICPGFSVDCLETLEEVDQENRHYFLQAGGEVFHYIPALNDNEVHINALLQLIQKNSLGWPTEAPGVAEGQAMHASALLKGANR